MSNRYGLIHMVMQYLLMAIGSFLLGYLIGRFGTVEQRLRALEDHNQPYRYNPPKKWTVQATVPPADVTIDESKFVTQVTTAGLEKPAEVALGDKQTVADDINGAASKLAQLKRS